MQLQQFAQELRNTELNYSCGSINNSLNGKVSQLVLQVLKKILQKKIAFYSLVSFFFLPSPLTLLTDLQLFKDFPLL